MKSIKEKVLEVKMNKKFKEQLEYIEDSANEIVHNLEEHKNYSEETAIIRICENVASLAEKIRLHLK